MSTQEAPFAAIIPERKPWWTRIYIWQLAGAAMMAIACVLVLILLVGNVGGWRRAKAPVKMIDANTYTITFDTDSGSYTHTVSRANAIRDLKDGQTFYFRYRTADPTIIESYTESMILGICLGVASLILAALAISMWRDDERHAAGLERVKALGTPVRAEVLSIFPDYMGLTRKSRNRYCRLDCAYCPETEGATQQESGQSRIWLFTSDRFAAPEHKFKGHVTVYVIPNAPDDYYVDLTSLEVEEVLDAPIDEAPVTK
jgi:hypothetical protein